MSYNYIVPFYDFLSRMVFGNRIFLSKSFFFKHIKSYNKIKILIIGGGTGDTLHKLPADASITFLDSSEKMLKRAKSRRGNNIEFKLEDCKTFVPKAKYDVVIIDFFLDQFSDKELLKIINKIDLFLVQNGRVLVSEFVINKRWHQYYLRIMYLFFRFTTGLNTSILPGWELAMENKFELISHKFFYSKFIKSAVYLKRI